MIHMYIPLAICIVIFLVTYKKVKGVENLLVIVSALGVAIFSILPILASTKPDLFLKVPETSMLTEDVINIGYDGTMILEESSGVGYTAEYIFDDSTTVTDLDDFIKYEDTNYTLVIKKGSDYLYRKSYPATSEDVFNEILGIYNSWKKNGVVPNDKVIYKFLCFYFEV